jgi:hypothetical protein
LGSRLVWNMPLTGGTNHSRHSRETTMPERETIERAREDAREGKAPTTQAGEFVREEIHHIREGKHGARSPEQAIAIGLSKARRAGVKLPPPRKGKAKASTRASAKRALKKARAGTKRKSPTRARAVKKALKREGRKAASTKALARHAKTTLRRRTAAQRSAAARKAAKTKGPSARAAAARKAARTRARRKA